MLVKVQEPIRHFKAYYQDNSLLIQLMIIEFFEIHQLVSSLKDWESSEDDIVQEKINHLKQCLISLIGESEEQNHAPALRWSKGPLLVLKDYCEHFFYNPGQKQNSQLKLSFYIYQIISSTMHVLHLLRSLETCVNFRQKNIVFSQIKCATQTLILHLHYSKRQLLTVLRKFGDNENVIFFLLRKKDLLIKIYGLEELNKLFKFFTKKHTLIELLINRFKSRGFHHLLPIIKQELFLYESYKHINS